MENSSTENQRLRLLIKCLIAKRLQTAEILYITIGLPTEIEVIKMLEFCRENPNASQEELLEASSKIYWKYEEEQDRLEEMYRAEMEAYEETEKL